MKKNAFILMVLSIITKIIGFLRDITLSYFYGVSGISDAYLVSRIIPINIFSLIGTGVSTTYIPLYSSIIEKNGVKTAERFTNNIICCLTIICTVMVIFGLIFTDEVVKLFASGFEGETLSLAVNLTRISLFGIYFSGLAYVFVGYLQLRSSFVVPALMGIPLNFVIILSIAASFKSSLIILAVGSVLALAFQLLFLIPFVFNTGYRFSFFLDGKDDYLIKMMKLSLPIILGISVNQINVLIGLAMASQLAVGGISALTYANRLNLFIQGIVTFSITTVMYPSISKMVAEKDFWGLKKSLSEAISGINLLIIPVMVGAMIFAEPIVILLFGRGEFDSQAVSMTSQALFYYSIGMIGFGLREVLSRIFYSLHDTKTPMINATIAVGLNLGLNIVLSKSLGIGGIALATSISAVMCTILLLFSLRTKIGSLGLKNITLSFVKILVASLVMGLIANLCYKCLMYILSANLSLVISVGIGGLSYVATASLMKIRDFDAIIFALRKKLEKSTYA